MFKNLLEKIFGTRKETEIPKKKIYYETSKNPEIIKKPEIKNNTKDKEIVQEVFKHFPDAEIISSKQKINKIVSSFTNEDEENYNTLIEMFEKIEKTDGLNKFKVNLSKSTKQKIERWKNTFTEYKINNQNENKELIDIVIGFDFGTSCSKIVVDFPFIGNIDTYAFPVPKEFRANNHEHCWKSILFYDKENDFFDIIPTNDSMVQLSDIKISLMNSSSNKIILKNKNIIWGAEKISVIYLGSLLKLIKGWVIADIVSKYYKNLKNIEYSWELNIGLPAAKIDADRISGLYGNILNSAWTISEIDQHVKMTNYDSIITDNFKKFNFLHIRPEVAAQSIGFIRSAMLDFGAYTVVDIGASTLDVCVFNYMNNDDKEKQALFTANVDLLGAESTKWIKIVNSQFNKKFIDNDLQIAIQSSIAKSLLDTKQTRAGTLREWQNTMPIIICGGGKRSSIHQNALKDLKDIWNSVNGGMKGNLKFLKPTLPLNLKIECDINEYHRLSVAWGLSIEQEIFAEIELPKDIKDLPKYKKIDWQSRFISKDDV